MDSTVVDIHIDSAVDNYIHIDSAVDILNTVVAVVGIAVVDIVPQVQKLILDYCWSSVVVVYLLLNRLINIIIVWGL